MQINYFFLLGQCESRNKKTINSFRVLKYLSDIYYMSDSILGAGNLKISKA